MLETYKSDDGSGFIEFSGCHSHYFGDATQTAHLDRDISCIFVSHLLPALDEARFENFDCHTSIEAVVGVCDTHKHPRLIAASVEEAGWRIGLSC